MPKGPHRAELKNGAEDWNRTSDTSIFSAVLYRLSYLGLDRDAAVGRTIWRGEATVVWSAASPEVRS